MANPRTIAKLEARILERAAHCLEFEISDPRSVFITVTKVELSSDLRSGKIFYSVLGSAGDKKKAEHMLKDAAGYLQRQIAKVLKVRRVPHLKWFYDDSVEFAARMDSAIDEALARDRAIHDGDAPPAGEAGDDWEAEYEAFQDEDA